MQLNVPRRVKFVAAAIVLGGISCPALAQSGTPSAPMDSVPEKTAPGPVSTDQPKNLSEKLDQSNGVIKPKEVDPAIEKPAPQTHTDDVIKPSATGSPAPQAK